MTSLSPGHRRKVSGEAPLSSGRKLRNLSSEKHSGLVPRFVFTPLTLNKLPLPAMQNSDCDSLLPRPSKLLLNVTIENSLGAIQVLMLPDDTVGDLVKAALAFYEREKRRPFLKDTNPKCYDLHYSPFSLQSLTPDKKLMNLGSRNFFLRPKPPISSRSDKENMAIDSAVPWVTFVHLLL